MQHWIRRFTPMDFFKLYFQILSKTGIRSLIVSGVLLVPAFILVGFFTSLFVNSLPLGSTEGVIGAENASGSWFGINILWGLIALVIYLYFHVLTQATITRLVHAEAFDVTLTWKDALQQTLFQDMRRVFPTFLLYVVYLVGGLVVLNGIGALATSTGLGLFQFLGTLVTIGGLGLVVIFFIRWVFVIQVSMIDHRYGNHALSYSNRLVTGKFIPVLGYLILIGILSSLAINLATLPLNLVFDFTAVNDHINRILATPENTQAILISFIRLIQEHIWGLTLVWLITVFLQNLLAGGYMTLLYYGYLSQKDMNPTSYPSPHSEPEKNHAPVEYPHSDDDDKKQQDGGDNNDHGTDKAGNSDDDKA